jgi:hypothetical protein
VQQDLERAEQSDRAQTLKTGTTAAEEILLISSQSATSLQCWLYDIHGLLKRLNRRCSIRGIFTLRHDRYIGSSAMYILPTGL